MTFTVQLTHANARFRDRLAAQLLRTVHPAAVEILGRCRFRFTVGPDHVEEVRRALKEIETWGAEVTES